MRDIVRIGWLLGPWLLLAGCSGGTMPVGDGGAAVTQQIVFMQPAGSDAVPGGDAVFEIAIMNLDGSGLRQLTNDGKQKFLPHFSPDATQLVYTKFSVGGYGSPNAQADVVVYDFASGGEIQLTHSGKGFQPAWSPDGRRIVYNTMGDSLHVMNADGSDDHLVIKPNGTQDEQVFGDTAWSSDDWILFAVAQNTNDCFKVRLDKIRPDGTERTQVTDGGPSCTPKAAEQSGDADPGFSSDGQTIYSSRGFPEPPAGIPAWGDPAPDMTAPFPTERKLFAFSSDAWYPGKPEMDLSLPSEPSCIEGVPKGSPDRRRILLYRICFNSGMPKGGIYVTDTAGSYRTLVTQGFGPDWNPRASQ
jgi:Tol biopolymer transport system component